MEDKNKIELQDLLKELGYSAQRLQVTRKKLHRGKDYKKVGGRYHYYKSALVKLKANQKENSIHKNSFKKDLTT